MKSLWVLLLVVVCRGSLGVERHESYEVDDDDFAEFDAEFLEEEVEVVESILDEQLDARGRVHDQQQDHGEEDEVEVEVEESLDEMDHEFSHFEDEEEFEGYRSDGDEFENRKPEDDDDDNSRTASPSAGPPPKTINITKVPAHLRTSWDHYYMEILMILGILVYVLNFFTGKTKNQRIAKVWFKSHRGLLESNFALVGDDGAKNIEDIETQVQKEAEHIFTLWCSGRTCCEGMLIELKLLKRQDLVSVIGSFMKPNAQDQVQVKVSMNKEDMDTFVFALATKKTATKMAKDLNDISTFCPDRRSTEKYNIPSHYQIMSEIYEASSAMMDAKLLSVMNKYPDAIDSIHFSDQYTGPKASDDQGISTLPEGKCILIFTFNLVLGKNNKTLESAVDNMKPLMLLVFYYMEKIKKYRLTREAKQKADKNRSKVAEAFWKSIHVAKAEKAQEERERKRREIKERIREIEDPDKQRKLEERENRRDRRKAAPKIKQLKVKAM